MFILDVNGAIFDWINDGAGHVSALDWTMEKLATLGIFAVLAIVGGSWFLRTDDGRTNRIAVYSAMLSAVLALLIALAIQNVYHHDRPFVERTDVVLLMHHSADASFPSEHTTVAVALAAGLGLWRWRLGVAALVIALGMGFARVWVGIHYPADIAGGAGVGALSAGIVYLARPALDWLDTTIVRRSLPAFLR